MYIHCTREREHVWLISNDEEAQTVIDKCGGICPYFFHLEIELKGEKYHLMIDSIRARHIRDDPDLCIEFAKKFIDASNMFDLSGPIQQYNF